MPKTTFLRLPEEKRQRIFEAALDELSSYRFCDISINRIVKAAKIPRGSFYTYFEDKEDMFIYVLKQISSEKLDIFSESHLQAEGQLNFFELLCAVMPRILDWMERNPRYMRFGMMMSQDNTGLVQQAFMQMEKSTEYMKAYLLAEQKAGRIRQDIQVDMILELIKALSGFMLQDFYQHHDIEAAMGRLTNIYDVLCHGILPR